MKAVNRVNIIMVPIAELHPNPWNPNVQSEFIFEKELKSITDYGFLDPVTARRRAGGGFEIIDGEHRWKAAEKLGLEEVPVNDLGEVEDGVAKKLTVIMNETKGKPDADLLGALFRDLEKTIGFTDMSESMPFLPSEIKNFMSDADVEWNKREDEQPKAPLEGKDSIEVKDGDWRVLTLQLPKDVASSFKEQIDRVKKILEPGEDAARISPIGAIQSISRVLGMLPDQDFTI